MHRHPWPESSPRKKMYSCTVFDTTAVLARAKKYQKILKQQLAQAIEKPASEFDRPENLPQRCQQRLERAETMLEIVEELCVINEHLKEKLNSRQFDFTTERMRLAEEVDASFLLPRLQGVIWYCGDGDILTHKHYLAFVELKCKLGGVLAGVMNTQILSEEHSREFARQMLDKEEEGMRKLVESLNGKGGLNVYSRPAWGRPRPDLTMTMSEALEEMLHRHATASSKEIDEDKSSLEDGFGSPKGLVLPTVPKDFQFQWPPKGESTDEDKLRNAFEQAKLSGYSRFHHQRRFLDANLPNATPLEGTKVGNESLLLKSAQEYLEEVSVHPLLQKREVITPITVIRNATTAIRRTPAIECDSENDADNEMREDGKQFNAQYQSWLEKFRRERAQKQAAAQNSDEDGGSESSEARPVSRNRNVPEDIEETLTFLSTPYVRPKPANVEPPKNTSLPKPKSIRNPKTSRRPPTRHQNLPGCTPIIRDVIWSHLHQGANPFDFPTAKIEAMSPWMPSTSTAPIAISGVSEMGKDCGSRYLSRTMNQFIRAGEEADKEEEERDSQPITVPSAAHQHTREFRARTREPSPYGTFSSRPNGDVASSGRALGKAEPATRRMIQAWSDNDASTKETSPRQEEDEVVASKASSCDTSHDQFCVCLKCLHKMDKAEGRKINERLSMLQPWPSNSDNWDLVNQFGKLAITPAINKTAEFGKLAEREGRETSGVRPNELTAQGEMRSNRKRWREAPPTPITDFKASSTKSVSEHIISSLYPFDELAETTRRYGSSSQESVVPKEDNNYQSTGDDMLAAPIVDSLDPALALSSSDFNTDNSFEETVTTFSGSGAPSSEATSHQPTVNDYDSDQDIEIITPEEDLEILAAEEEEEEETQKAIDTDFSNFPADESEELVEVGYEAENTDSEWSITDEIEVMADEKEHMEWQKAEKENKGWLGWALGRS